MSFGKETHFTIKGITHRIFLVFVCTSLLAILYFNLTDVNDLKLLASKFPEIPVSVRNTFLHTYKVASSLSLFFADIILVGPFAYLSYFSDHIKPNGNKLLNSLSFFDFGLLLALVFTLWCIAIQFVVVNAVSKTPNLLCKMIDNEILAIALGVLTFVWLFLLVLKVYSYSAAQRKELSKYAIRF